MEPQEPSGPYTSGGCDRPHPRLANQDFQTTTLNRHQPPASRHHLRSSSNQHNSEMDLTAFDGNGHHNLPYHHHASVQHHHLPRHHNHELRRPDSVITTSSAVSSDAGSSQADTEASSSAAASNVYTISGLYGRPKGATKESSALGSTPTTTSVSADTRLTPLSSLASTTSSLEANHFYHRRQTSHPGNFDSPFRPPPPKTTSSTLPSGCCAPTAATVAAAAAAAPPSRGAAAAVTLVGHRRSNSYGHHRALTATCSLGAASPSAAGLCHHHRRTGSSVIETLQTLACNGGAETVDRREESIAHFLEQLKKEQQEKYEKQELHEMQDELEDLRDCGLGGCRPKFIQGLANIKVFVFLLSLLVTLQQALSSGYLNSVITTIEKRYEIPSSISGIIASMYELGNLGTVIFVSYLGSRRHIPAWIGMGVLVMGVGSITFSLPHFLSGNYMVSSSSNSTENNICARAGSTRVNGAAGGFSSSGSGRSRTGLRTAKDEDILNQLPGLDKIKSLTEGLSSPPLGPHNNNYNREDNCIEEANESAAMPIFIFMVAQLLLGCGGSPLFTLGTTYIDNHVKRDDSSMYIGIMYSMCAFGPVCGFLLGAYLLSHFVDTFSPSAIVVGIVDSSDRHWIGMWWGGFLICGVALVVIAIPFFFFPKELKKEKVKVYIDEKYHHATDPSIRPRHKHHHHHHHHGSGSGAASKAGSKSNTLKSDAGGDGAGGQSSDSYGKDIKDIPKSTWKLLTNKIYMVTCLGACMELIIVSGFIVFLPKYLETQFNLSKSMASMFTGGIAIPGACIGIFLGGYILKRLSLRPKGAVTFVILCNVICLACYGMLFFFGCDNIKMAGTTMPYSYSNQSEPFKINLTASCNFGCECDMNDVQPVCGANGLTYFSPCHAGCTSLGNNSDNFTDCACVLNSLSDPLLPGPLHPTDTSGLSSNIGEFAEVTMVPVATSGPCYSTCKMIMPFMVLLFFMTLVVAVTQMPVLMVVLRSVEEEEKAFALGIQFVIFRVFGYIPSPILFGNVIDSTCLLWKSTCQGEAGGRCLLYDIELFRYKYVGVCCFIKILSVIIFLLDWWLIRNRQNSEKKNAALTVGEVVNSIISLDKLFDPDGPVFHKVSDPEGESCGSDSSDEDEREKGIEDRQAIG